MSESFSGQSIARLEDQRLITGGERYTSDRVPKNAVRAVFVRSLHAHAEITAIESAAAAAAPGGGLLLPVRMQAQCSHPVYVPHGCTCMYAHDLKVGHWYVVSTTSRTYTLTRLHPTSGMDPTPGNEWVAPPNRHTRRKNHALSRAHTPAPHGVGPVTIRVG
jgi:hypothetical protein